MDWLIYLGVPATAIALAAWLLSKILRRKRPDDDSGDDFEHPESEVPAPLKPRPRTKSASAVVDLPEVEEEDES